ncbi:MAG: nucleoside monophosphate kinase [Clostridium sp.]|nr:nucleoside monophosphate kinase [Clostridium sp.]
MNIVLLGGPGSGKGTVSNLFEKTQNMGHIATGDMFREEIKNETELGKKAQEYIDKGNLVPDEITINMLKGKINQFKDSNGVVFDGFPRNKKQAEALEEMLEEQNQKVDLALFLDIPDEDIIYRTIKRRICSNKDIEYYEEKGLLYKVKLHANVNITEEMISEWLKNYNESR